MPWIQLLRGQVIEKAGIARQYHPGDWVEVGKQTAQRWVVDGAARYASAQTTVSLDGCGVVALGNTHMSAELGVDVTLKVVAPELRYAKTLVAGAKVRPELLPVGFGLLDTWEVACPLWDYGQLAIHEGSRDERSRTEAVIGDLRVPLYESRMVFIKRCRAGEALVKAWNEERAATGDDDRLCFLRALYQVKPLICALPVTWHKAA